MKIITIVIILAITIVSCNRTTSEETTSNKVSNALWTALEKNKIPNSFLALDNSKRPTKFQLYRLMADDIKSQLNTAKDRNDEGAYETTVSIPFPNHKGELVNYKIVSTTLMEKELADKYPELKTYEGISTIEKRNLIRISRNKIGIDAMILSLEGTIYIDPIELNNEILYLVYHKDDFITDKKDRFYEPPLK